MFLNILLKIQTFLFISASCSTHVLTLHAYRMHGRLRGIQKPNEWPQNVSIWDSMEGGMRNEGDDVDAGVKTVSRAPWKIMYRVTQMVWDLG